MMTSVEAPSIKRKETLMAENPVYQAIDMDDPSRRSIAIGSLQQIQTELESLRLRHRGDHGIPASSAEALNLAVQDLSGELGPEWESYGYRRESFGTTRLGLEVIGEWVSRDTVLSKIRHIFKTLQITNKPLTALPGGLPGPVAKASP
jgi:hypothetical protein